MAASLHARLGIALLGVFLLVRSAVAQEAPEPVPLPGDTITADTARTGVSPSGAFIRSILVPGWGQAANGAYVRGGAFFGLQAGSGFMLLKTLAKLGEAREMEARQAGVVRDSLLAAAASDEKLRLRYENDPRALELDVQENERVAALKALVKSREQQREDWIAMAIFVTLMSGVDAIVNAHLMDFPARVDVEHAGRNRFSVGLTIPAGGSP